MQENYCSEFCINDILNKKELVYKEDILDELVDKDTLFELIKSLPKRNRTKLLKLLTKFKNDLLKLQ